MNIVLTKDVVINNKVGYNARCRGNTATRQIPKSVDGKPIFKRWIEEINKLQR